MTLRGTTKHEKQLHYGQVILRLDRRIQLLLLDTIFSCGISYWILRSSRRMTKTHSE